MLLDYLHMDRSWHASKRCLFLAHVASVVLLVPRWHHVLSAPTSTYTWPCRIQSLHLIHMAGYPRFLSIIREVQDCGYWSITSPLRCFSKHSSPAIDIVIWQMWDDAGHSALSSQETESTNCCRLILSASMHVVMDLAFLHEFIELRVVSWHFVVRDECH